MGRQKLHGALFVASERCVHQGAMFACQIALLPSSVVPTFMPGLAVLRMEWPGIPDFAERNERLPGHGEPVARMKALGILADGSQQGGLLLQIFTTTLIGPIFFEIIQRKGDEGFGEGNFKALFESMERDQIRRGVLDTAEA